MEANFSIVEANISALSGSSYGSDIPVNLFTGKFLEKSSGEHIRIINIFIAIWFAIFSIPTFIFK